MHDIGTAGSSYSPSIGTKDKTDPTVLIWAYEMPPLEDGWRYLQPGAEPQTRWVPIPVEV